MHLILTLLAFGLSVFIVARVMPSVHVDGFWTAVWVSVVYGILKFLLYWILVFFSLPMILVTMGLFLLVINAFLLWMTDRLVAGFEITGLFNTLLAAVLISILDMVFRRLIRGASR